MTSGIEASRLALWIAAALVAGALPACQTLNEAPLALSAIDAKADAEIVSTPPEPEDLTHSPSGESLRLGLEHFKRGDSGLAQRYFRDAVEKSPNDAVAWIGLAASYDHIRRFDLVDRAYRMAIKLSGETAQILNNQGYSYMLRGDFKTARAKFRKAYERDPNNPTILNNIELVNSSGRSSPRAP